MPFVHVVVGAIGEPCGSAENAKRQEQVDAASRPSCGNRGLRGQHAGQPAERGKAHDPDIEEAGIAPLDIHAQGHDGGDQAEIEHHQADRPGLTEPNEQKQRRHDGEGTNTAHGLAHSTLPRKIPVGRNSSTTTRMRKETANL